MNTTKTESTMQAKVAHYVTTLPATARQDIAEGQWDEVATDALYAACGAETVDEMSEARSIAEEAAK